MLKNLETPFSKQVLEIRASKLLRAYSQCSGWSPSLPVPIEDIVERELGLRLLWDNLGSATDRMILGELRPEDRLIVLNESVGDHFTRNPGSERFTLAHEAGHWDLHVDQDKIDHPVLFSVERQSVVCSEGDSSPSETSANHFASFLLLPRDLLKAQASECDLTETDQFRSFARHAQVSFTALHIALMSQGIAHVWN